jgi:hypothetical protein
MPSRILCILPAARRMLCQITTVASVGIQPRHVHHDGQPQAASDPTPIHAVIGLTVAHRGFSAGGDCGCASSRRHHRTHATDRPCIDPYPPALGRRTTSHSIGCPPDKACPRARYSLSHAIAAIRQEMHYPEQDSLVPPEQSTFHPATRGCSA